MYLNLNMFKKKIIKILKVPKKKYKQIYLIRLDSMNLG